jgi:uncharacterized membrane protein
MATAKTAAKGKESEPNALYIVAYLLTWLTGIIVFVAAKPSEKRLRANALQATFLGIVITVLWFIPVVGWVAAVVLWLVGVIAGLRAYNGEDIHMPVIWEYAKRYS